LVTSYVYVAIIIIVQAGVILGTTEAEQRSLGMVNNRVFEALSVGGAHFLSDSFPALDELSLPLSTHTVPGDAFTAASIVLALNESSKAALAHAGRKAILEAHTYDHRVATLLPWLDRTFGLRQGWLGEGSCGCDQDTEKGGQRTRRDRCEGGGKSPRHHSFEPSVRRPNAPKVLLLYGAGSGVSHLDGEDDSDPLLHLGLLPAITLATRSCCSLDLRRLEESDFRAASTRHRKGQVGTARKASNSSTGNNIEQLLDFALRAYSLVLVRAQWGSPLQRAVSDAAQRLPAFALSRGRSAGPGASRGDRWEARGALGLLLRSSSAAHPSRPTKSGLFAFDVVLHDSPSLVCQNTASTDSVQTNGFEDCDHPNSMPSLCVDLSALREGSQGWHDGESGRFPHRFDYAVLVPGLTALGDPAGDTITRLCGRARGGDAVVVLVTSPISELSLFSSRRVVNAGLSVGEGPQWEGRAKVMALRDCGIVVLGNLLDRPERIAMELRSAAKVEVLPLQAVRGGLIHEEVDRSADWPDGSLEGGDAVLLLAALAAGCEVVVHAHRGLAALLEDEVRNVASLGKPPLQRFDVSASSPRPESGLDFRAEGIVAMDTQVSLSLSLFGQTLASALEEARVGPRASASVTIVEPAESVVTVPLAACLEAWEQEKDVRVRVRVSLVDFRVPDDGTWCLQVAGSEVACFGDAKFSIEAPLPPLPSWGQYDQPSGATDTSMLSSWCVAGGTVDIRAVLRGGDIEAPHIVRSSPVVRLLVVP
jgi:hypothetical protein